jgi:hypothetical protein
MVESHKLNSRLLDEDLKPISANLKYIYMASFWKEIQLV